jgi:hypothetical protein
MQFLYIILIFLQDNVLFKKNYIYIFVSLYTVFPLTYPLGGGVTCPGIPVSETWPVSKYRAIYLDSGISVGDLHPKPCFQIGKDLGSYSDLWTPFACGEFNYGIDKTWDLSSFRFLQFEENGLNIKVKYIRYLPFLLYLLVICLDLVFFLLEPRGMAVLVWIKIN